MRQLAGFQRVSLAAGQSRTVTFTISGSTLGYYDNNGHFVLQPGGFDAWVGDSSLATLHGRFALHR